MFKKWLLENKFIIGFIGLSISLGIAGGIMQFLIPLYIISLNASDAEVGLIKGLAQVGGLLITLPGGFLIDRFGGRKIYIISTLINTLIIFTIPLAYSLPILIIFLFLEGTSGNVRWTAINTAFFERLKFFGYGKAGWLRASAAIGMNFIGPLMGGQMVQKMSYQKSFYIIGILIFMPVCLMFLLKQTPQRPVRDKPKQKANIYLQFKQLIKNKLLLRTALLQSIAMASTTSFSLFLVVMVVNRLHYTPQVASMIVSTQGIGFILIMFWGGGMLSTRKIYYLYTVCFTLQIIGLIAVGFISALWVIWVGSVIFGLGAGLITTVSYTLLGEMKGEKGKIAGFFYTITGSGIALGPVFAGFLALIFGIKAAFTGFLPIEFFVVLYFVSKILSEKKKEKGFLQEKSNKELAN